MGSPRPLETQAIDQVSTHNFTSDVYEVYLL